MPVPQTAECRARTRTILPEPVDVLVFEYDDNLISETETIARFLDTERGLSLDEIFAAR
jgi:hypothetical protein